MILWIFFSANHFEVSKSKSKIQKAGEATAKSTRAVCSAILQWNDAKHPRIQRVARLPTLSTPQFNQPLSSSNKFITEYIMKLCWTVAIFSEFFRTYSRWARQLIQLWRNHFRCHKAPWVPSGFDKTPWVRYLMQIN